MTNLQKLTALLCEVEEIKEDIKKVKEWCRIKYKKYWFKKLWIITAIKNDYIFTNMWDMINNYYKIIWSYISYEYLLLYWKYNNVNIFISYLWWVWDDNNYICNLDLTLPLHKQSEEVLWALVEYLSNIK